ncbi:MAG: metallophosphoesterase [Desulfatitalea sp.]|nr:metallophosphoesterase [Desulfatitalea sp.]NNK02344.1 metallophosphoesterase [Desulfatitalea sp.]
MGSLSRWVVFLTVFLCIYGAFHLYVLVKVRRSLYLEGWSYILLFVVLVFLMIAPLQARFLYHQGYDVAGLITSWIAYLWMGYLFIFTCIGAPIDLYHLALGGVQNLFDADLTQLMLSRRQNFIISALLAGCLCVYGAFSTYHVNVETVTIHSTKIPPGRPLCVVQISDLHLGPMFIPGRMNQILAEIRTAQPDILVSTGDLIDGPMLGKPLTAQVLNALPTPMGKFAVTGNHESYMGEAEAEAFTRAAGFKLLHNAAVTVENLITIAGEDDPSFGPVENSTKAHWSAAVQKDRFTLLLKHIPDVAAPDQAPFDLQLSGHTHQGQIFPFSLLVGMVYPMNAGLYALSDGRRLYVSRGTGTWGPPFRILAPPEITVIHLVPTATTKQP